MKQRRDTTAALGGMFITVGLALGASGALAPADLYGKIGWSNYLAALVGIPLVMVGIWLCWRSENRQRRQLRHPRPRRRSLTRPRR